MIIVCEWHFETVFDAATANAMRNIVEECMLKRESIAAVFLFVAGKAFTNMPLPIWARNAKGGMDTAQDNAEDHSETQAVLKVCLEELTWLPQPLVGLVDGRICGIGSALLEACDLIMATKATEFQTKTSHGCTRTVGISEAQQVGFVSQTVDTEAQLFEECDNMRQQLASYTPQARYAIKQMFPESTMPLHCLLEEQSANLCSPSIGDGWKPDKNKRCLPPGIAEQAHVEIGNMPPPQPSHMLTKQMTHQLLGVKNFKEQTGNLSKQGSQQVPRTPGPHEPMKDAECATDGKASSGRVQRKKELVAQSVPRDGPITSLMICNIPCRITQQELVQAMDSMGFYGTFDFVYLPTAARSASSTTSNLGYGFVNFIDSHSAAQFTQQFQSYQFKGTGSNKVCTLRPAQIQGLAQNVQNFSNNVARHKSPGPFVRFFEGRTPTEEELQALSFLQVCVDKEPAQGDA